MTDVAIRVENLGKKYQLGGQKSGSFRESLTRLLRRPETGDGRPGAVTPDSGLRTSDSAFWALKDINFEIKRGETVVLENMSFQVLNADNRRVHLMKVTLLQNPDATQSTDDNV